jgi:alkanesulfonate monooxygenase SsuD/methylene tetrahydromethanopterin reductase-like flavin-dependent oxidoreductase (luciferase family)
MVLGVAVGWIEQVYAYLRADFPGRGQVADEYLGALRALFESDNPQFHGPHIDYSDVIFSPRPSPRLPVVVGGTVTRP